MRSAHARCQPGPSPDQALLERVAGGDVNALHALYAEHASRAMAIAMRILRRQEEAEEVVQDTFLEVWRRAGQFDDARGGAQSWIVTIARSRAIDRLRASGTELRAFQTASGMAGVAPEALTSPAVATQERSDEVRVVAALAELPAEQRETIELAYYAGLSQSEIAAKTGRPLGTVKMRVRLAIKKLNGLLKEEEP